jgi:Phosphodiester glycosidase
VLRPASRRAGRRNAPYEPDQYETGPYGSQPPYEPRASYGPQSPYDPAASSGSGPQPFYEPGPQPLYEPGPQPPYHPGPRPPYHPGPRPPYQPRPQSSYEPGPPPDQPGPRPGRRGPGGRRKRGRGRIRRFFRLRTVRVILALVAVFCIWVAFSVGQALTAPGGGSTSSKLAEWARDHYLGPVVTFGEWLTYQPPKVGGKPSFSLAVPSGTAKKYKTVHGLAPDIPEKLTSPVSHPLPGEGVWRVLETVHGEPAVFGTFLRPDAIHTSYVAGLVSMDQRLVTFQLRPGAEDPGPGNWKAEPWIPPGTRAGLLATFNSGFKLDSAGGGFYLNGSYRGTLVDGAASVVYYRNGTIKIGEWGRDFRMTPNVVGVRQNLKLIVDQGKIPANVNQDVLGSWGATLGGGYYVWRSGVGITKDGRIVFVYGPGLITQTLAELLKKAGAVEAMQLDINPEWMSYDYYKAGGHPADPTPHALLPDQQGSPYRYYSVFSRDFTAVYAR